MSYRKLQLTQMEYMGKLLYSNIECKKSGEKQREERLSRSLLVRGVPVKRVGHEENVGSRRDEGMARFHNLKAQKTECTHQFNWKKKAGGTEVRQQPGPQQHRLKRLFTVQSFSGDSRPSWGLTAVFSVLVKADVDTFNFQMFLSILQESSKTGEGTENVSAKTLPSAKKVKSTSLPLFTVFGKQDTRYLHKKCVAP